MLNDFVSLIVKNNPFFYRRLKEVNEFYRLDGRKLMEYESLLLQKTVKSAYKNSKFYKEIYDEAGVDINTIKTREDLAKLPQINKESIRSRIDDIYFGSSYIRSNGYTSGTSGSPLKVYRSFYNITTEAAYIEAFRRKVGFVSGSPLVSLRGRMLDEFYRKDKVNNILYLSSFQINNKTISRFARLLREFRPSGIHAYPSALEALANNLQKAGINDITIPYLFTSSEQLYSFQIEKLESFFKGRIYDRYGNAERTIRVEKGDSDFYNEAPLYSINTYHQNGTLTTSLVDPYFPLINYFIDDIIEVKQHGVKPIISKILGRTNDVVLLKNGTKIGSAALSLAFKDIKGLSTAQIVQKTLDQITVNIVVSSAFDFRSEKKLYNEINTRLSSSIKISIHKVNGSSIVKSNQGKYKLIVSEINKQ